MCMLTKGTHYLQAIHVQIFFELQAKIPKKLTLIYTRMAYIPYLCKIYSRSILYLRFITVGISLKFGGIPLI